MGGAASNRCALKQYSISIFHRPCSDGIATLSCLHFDPMEYRSEIRYITGTYELWERGASFHRQKDSFATPDLPFWGSTKFVEFAYLGDVFYSSPAERSDV